MGEKRRAKCYVMASYEAQWMSGISAGSFPRLDWALLEPPVLPSGVGLRGVCLGVKCVCVHGNLDEYAVRLSTFP